MQLWGTGFITSDQAVVRTMKSALPFLVATLTMHGTAVTLEGVLLAKRDLVALNRIYACVAASILMAYTYVRRSGTGLLGVWSVYVWFQFSRLLAFGFRSDVFRFGRKKVEAIKAV